MVSDNLGNGINLLYSYASVYLYLLSLLLIIIPNSELKQHAKDNIKEIFPGLYQFLGQKFLTFKTILSYVVDNLLFPKGTSVIFLIAFATFIFGIYDIFDAPASIHRD